MVVDDHQLFRRGIVASIREERPQWEIAGEASNGRDAVALAPQLKPGIVVMDISMPGLNGLDATRQILHASPATRVLVVTMHESEQFVRDVLDSGARGYILKTDAATDLISALDALRQGKVYFSSTIAETLLQSYIGDCTRPKPAPVISAREREIVQLVAEGKSNKEVAQELGISVKTVETHRAHIMAKLDLHSISDLVRYAIRNGILQA